MKLRDAVLHVCSIASGILICLWGIGGLIGNPVMNFARQAAGLQVLPVNAGFSPSLVLHISSSTMHKIILSACLIAGVTVSLMWPGTQLKVIVRKSAIMLLVTVAAYYIFQLKGLTDPWVVPGKYGAAYVFYFYFMFWIPVWIGYLLGEAYIVGFRRLFWKEKV